MKIRALHILVLIIAVSTGVALLSRPNSAPKPIHAPPLVAPKKETRPAIKNIQPQKPVSEPEPSPQPIPKAEPPPPPKPPQVEQKKETAQTDQQKYAKYWQYMARRFGQQLTQLDQETDPARRSLLIKNIAGHIRVDTISTLEWAATLEDPAEQRAALEAINKNALVGIGARIQMGEAGMPQIVDTTILSALEATGQAGPGDYISGMINPDGSITHFKGRSLRQIVDMLRGKPGTDVQLLIERQREGSSEFDSFEVSPQRSMIVIEPPF